ncbi:MAG: helix-turn-helix transcriptional regulator [Acidimicrobiales bacterium]
MGAAPAVAAAGVAGGGRRRSVGGVHGTGVGPLLADWRARRRRSQLDLAHEIGVSPRHLSFVETGRSTPSPEVVLAVARGLDVPLRERNALLLAAGYAPRYAETALDDPSMARVRSTLQRLLDAHDPYPGVVIDRRWDVVVANRAAALLSAGLPRSVTGPPLNVFRACLHPEGLAPRTANLAAWATYLLTTLHRLVVATGDDHLLALEAEVTAYPDIAAIAAGDRWRDPDDPPLLVPLQLEVDGVELALFSTLTTFGTPTDITLSELSVELFFPADDETEALLHAAAPAG